MNLVFKHCEGTQAEKPNEIDYLSSPNTVYIRKNIERVEKTTYGTTITVWEYDEAQCTKIEWIDTLTQMLQQNATDIDEAEHELADSVLMFVEMINDINETLEEVSENE